MGSLGHYCNTRVRKKLKKYLRENNFFFASIKIAFYVLNDLINLIITKIVLLINPSKFYRKKITFLEPRKQGFGDLLFQTPLYESLMKKGYSVEVIIDKKHFPIIKNNPYISNIIFWNDFKSILLTALKRENIIIYLGKNTLLESFMGLFSIFSHRAILDQDIELWQKLFKENHTRAWQTLTKVYVDSKLVFGKAELFHLKKEEQMDKKIKQLAVIVGVDKSEKRYKEMETLIFLCNLLKNTEVTFLGICDEKYAKKFEMYINKPFRNLINKLNYEQTLHLLSKMDAVIGTEGSLVHMSTTLGVPTIIIETNSNSFWNVSNLEKNQKIITVHETIEPNEVLEKLTEFEEIKI